MKRMGKVAKGERKKKKKEKRKKKKERKEKCSIVLLKFYIDGALLRCRGRTN